MIQTNFTTVMATNGETVKEQVTVATTVVALMDGAMVKKLTNVIIMEVGVMMVTIRKNFTESAPL